MCANPIIGKRRELTEPRPARSDIERMAEVPVHRPNAVGQRFGCRFRQKGIASAPCGARTPRPVSAAVENARRSFGHKLALPRAIFHRGRPLLLGQ
jgi:hypothetical protein